MYTQIIAATAGGRVNAVQHGDQYNYIYRGSPPYRVEPFPVVGPAALPTGLARVPSRLLTARHQVVPFFPRPELALLESWREDLSPGLSVRLVHAEGGSGKSRLAAEFAARSARNGWAVALARHHSEVASAGGGDETLTVRAPGLVMVVDYAERWPLEDLITLVRQHRDAARDRLRILLLSRPAGTWWQGLAHQFAKLDILDVEAVRLEALPNTPGVRSDMYIAARDRFAEILGFRNPVRIGVPDRLDDPVFALTLTVHMRALVDVDAATRGQTPPTGSGQASLSSYLLDREHDYWRSAHDQGNGPVRATEQGMGRAVYVATLTRSLSPADAAEALVRAGVADTAAAGEQLVEDHSRCYPSADHGLALDPLAPDRLGEDYLALTLPGHEEEFGYHATDVWAIDAPARLLAPTDEAGRPPAYTRQSLSVVIEAAQRWPHLTTRHLDPLLRRNPELALAGGSAALTRLADLTTLDDSVLEAIEPHLPDHAHTDLDLGAAAVTARLTEHRLTTATDPATRAALHSNVSKRYGYAGLHRQALDSARQAADLFAELAAADPVVYLPELGMSLGNLSLRLSEVGRREEAVAPVREAAAIFRELAKADSAAHLPVLASWLSHMGLALAAAGQREEAVAPSQEAVGILSGLVKDNPAAHTSRLAGALNNLSIQLAEAGRREESLAAIQEIVDIFAELAKNSPATYLPARAAALNNLGKASSAMGRRKEALAPTQQAVSIYRGLAEVNPGAYLADLAASLTNLGIFLANLGRREESVAPLQEAVGILSGLVKDNPAARTIGLAGALSSLGRSLAEVGRREEAVTAAREAARLYRELATDNPAAHMPKLAAVLDFLGLRLWEVGRQDEAVAIAQEAVGIVRKLVKANRAAHLPTLAGALGNLSIQMTAAGRHKEALQSAREATGICRELEKTNPAAYKHELAATLNNLGRSLAETGRREEAVTAAREAARLYRELAADNPAAHMPDFAMTLSNLGSWLWSVNRNKEALSPTEEAVAIRRELAKAIPAVHLPELAGALNNLSVQLSAMGRQKEAVAPAQESARLFRESARANPAVHLPNLAMALDNLGVQLSAVGRRKESLAPAQEAEAIRRELAKAKPAKSWRSRLWRRIGGR
ncbi:tetratricopeptide repeat protein (plasmid) [Streptomyces anulatus]|uniref:tetratricopeptide repeat protein n=1 Tax=Streptomyces anulatus TaxID=1892 RepID=UPI0038640EFB|nr:tetratricopeptide repeat protein [Streptomyces anulatus]